MRLDWRCGRSIGLGPAAFLIGLLARIGGGSYFDAADGAALVRAFRASLRLP